MSCTHSTHLYLELYPLSVFNKYYTFATNESHYLPTPFKFHLSFIDKSVRLSAFT